MTATIGTSGWQKLALLAFSTTLTLLAVEIILRLFYPAPYYGFESPPPQRQLFQYDATLGWKGRPNAKSTFAGTDFFVTVTQDRYGHRNRTAPFAKEKQNLLVLGDSYGWGWGVGDDELFSSYIVRTSGRFNVYNLSAPGYGTDQEYLALIRFLSENGGSRYRGVFLLFYFNDFGDVLETVRYGYPKPRFVLQNGRLVVENIPVPELKKAEYDRSDREPVQRWSGGLLRSLHVYNLVRLRGVLALEGLTGSRPASDGEHGGSPVGKQRPARANQALTLQLLRDTAALCGKHDMFFHVVLLKTSNTSEEWLREIERLSGALAAYGIEHSWFFSRTFPSTDLWIDGHLSKHGHRLLASHLLDILRHKKI